MFPAKVTTPTETFDRARVHLANGRLRVWTAENGEGVRLVLERDVAEIVPQRRSLRASADVKTTDGELVAISKGAGCGCGHPLKSFNPATWNG